MMGFDYYYGSQADQFSFIRIPRSLITDETFASLSIPAKLLYGLFLDRMGLSMKNGWFDEQNRVYIIYQIAEIQEDMALSKKKAISYLNELEQFGLVEKKRRGLGLPSILYVKSFLIDRDYSKRGDDSGQDEGRDGPDEDFHSDCGSSRSACSDTSVSAASDPDSPSNESCHPGCPGTQRRDIVSSLGIIREQEEYGQYSNENAVYEDEEPSESGEDSKICRSDRFGTLRGVKSGTSRSVGTGTSRGADTALQEVPEWELQEVPDRAPLKNNTNTNKTEWRYIESNHISSYQAMEDKEEMRAFAERIDQNIGYEDLLLRYPYKQKLVKEIRNLILEAVMARGKTFLIASNQYPAELVRSRFLELDYSHVEYVIECFRENTSKVKNIKKYLLAALFNAPSTMSGYYTSQVHHDMPYLAGKGR